MPPANPPKPDPQPPTTATSKSVSMRQVAAAAGVSIATVSRVLNNPSTVSKETAARVQDVIARLGYAPNPLAQLFGAGESHLLGLALPILHGEFYTNLFRGADMEATRLGYHLIVTTITTRPDASKRDSVLGTGIIDGMAVVIVDAEDPIIPDVVASKIPTVIIDADLSSQGLDSVGIDNATGAREAIDHLLRWVEPARCYFVGGPRQNWDTMHRARAFEAALAEHGWKVKPDQVSCGEYSAQWGREWALRAIQRGWLQKAAVLAGNDDIACGIMRAAEDARVYVPDQLRIVGFDNTRMAELVRPKLSSIALPMEQLGIEAVRTLVDRIDHPHTPPRCMRLPTKLIVRESSTAMAY